MQNTKVIALLQTFTKEELKSFDDFIQSPYFNKREAPVKLYAALLPYYPDFSNLKPEKVFKKAFPNKAAFSDSYLRNVLSDLYELGLDFLRQEAAEKSNISGEFICVQKLIYRKLFKQAEQHLEKVHEWIEKSWLEHDYNALLADYHTFKMILHDRAEEQLAYSEAHQQKVNCWEKAIWEKILTLIYETETDKREYYNFTYNTQSLKKMLPLFNVAQFEDTPMLQAAYYRAMLIANPSWETFNSLHQLAKATGAKMPDNQTYSCYQALLGFTSHLMRHSVQTETDLVPLQMELLQAATQLRRNNNLHITDGHYTNMAFCGYTLYGFDWAVNFIEVHTTELLPYLQQDLPLYCKAIIWFKEKKYRDALALLASLPNFRSDVYFSIKPYMLMCYYELNDNDASEFLFNTLKKTFKNHPNLSYRVKDGLRHFIDLYGQLVKLCEQYNAPKATKLKDAILQPDTPMFAKQWLYDKIVELETNKLKKRSFSV